MRRAASVCLLLALTACGGNAESGSEASPAPTSAGAGPSSTPPRYAPTAEEDEFVETVGQGLQSDQSDAAAAARDVLVEIRYRADGATIDLVTTWPDRGAVEQATARVLCSIVSRVAAERPPETRPDAMEIRVMNPVETTVYECG